MANTFDVDTSNKYPVAPVLAIQFAVKAVCTIDVAAEATGLGGIVVSEMVFELKEVPDALEALTR